MALDPVLIQHVFEQSLTQFFANEVDAILSKVSERNNCGRLAIYLDYAAKENGLNSYYADTEWNRKQNGKIKTILDGEYKVISITCDLILHSRGKIVGADNLIAIEMKKSDRPKREKQKDEDRLRALTKAWSLNSTELPEHVCGYVLGAYIEINADTRTSFIEFYSSGSKSGQAEYAF